MVNLVLVVVIYLMVNLLLNSGIHGMKKILFLILLLSLPMSNLSASEGEKFYSPVVKLLNPAIGLYERAKSSVVQSFNNLISKSTEKSLNLNFQSIEQPLSKGFDFVCYNSCKERNDETFCMQQCSLK